jgi:hypothetical protein
VRLLIEPHDRQLVGLNNDSNKLKKLLKRVRGGASRLLSRLIKKKRPIARPRGGAQPHEPHEAPPASTSRGGRAIRTPVRFL